MNSQTNVTKRDNHSCRDPILTFSNIIQKALEHRQQHDIKSTDLAVICEHMSRTTFYIPSVAIMRKGLRSEHYNEFAKRASKSMHPKKNAWQTAPYTLPKHPPRQNGRPTQPNFNVGTGNVQNRPVLQGARALRPPRRRPDTARDSAVAHAVVRAPRAHPVGGDGSPRPLGEQEAEGAVTAEQQAPVAELGGGVRLCLE